MKRGDLGRLGEDLAAEYLKKQGYKILDRNFHSRVGELDIVAQDKETLVFIEVKTRWSKKFGLPVEAITSWKLKSILKTAEYYKLLHSSLPDSLRIDAVAIEIDQNNNPLKFDHLKNISM
ncbi:MAG: hypothetical protein A2Y57_00255 [Candidatus Woykebacteria bacterium RBG_13_40_7b]|uniref:UPF0102 protein A2Y57_00255 n=1 Tax=Candidatus Woykebacteria bacterium RBG_13_40_7b TaxID=1802594 RepID=A0A1G1WAX6_9BACT|nr:MAG: hypothetical protein A2Y57_00255 [Candidatus Woykebacteria bacterium RBG_13_40_7b]